MSDKGKTSTTLSFRCPQDMLDAIDSIGREHYPTDKNSKTNSGCDRSKTLFHIIQAGIAAITDGNIQIEVRQSKTDSKTAIDQGELTELVKKLIAENKVIQPSNTDDDSVLHLIKESIADGDIKDAISNSYAAVMGNFNGLLEELQDIKSQLQELQIPPAAAAAAAANDKLTIPCSQLPDIEKSTIENIRTTLKRKAIQSVSNDQIRAAFKDAGWDGNNFNEIKKDILAILSGDKK
ncbi:hypothetical protein QHH11_15965 [Aphanizomenon sp. PH219]|nr:hypothetical protein [Aphanizomenon sp. 202]MDK2460614.1 hypothetical protein [Aphanizomenon sp. PH219]